MKSTLRSETTLHRWRRLSLVSLCAALGLLAVHPAAGADTAIAAQAINTLGLELLARTSAPTNNALLSPYSIQSALAMTYAGADGQTRTEMARVLHFPNNDAALHGAFSALQAALDALTKSTMQSPEAQKLYGVSGDPVTLTVANRLFGQQGFEFRPSFLSLVKDSYGAPLEQLDFAKPAAASQTINTWVERQTRDRIRNLVPASALSADTRLVLVNAIYLKAPWIEEFPAHATQPRPFHMCGGKTVEVPTLLRQAHFGYAQREGYAAVTIPYRGGGLHFLVLLPDAADGLAALEQKLTAAQLAACARLPTPEVILQMPKLKLEPPPLSLAKPLQALGMKSAFNVPAGSANFDRMAPPHAGASLCISEVLHKTFLALDEKGTEAAAATAVMMAPTAIAVGERPKPIVVNVDRPYLFAIQHRASGACLFLGRVTDPR
jgi:serpin B